MTDLSVEGREELLRLAGKSDVASFINVAVAIPALLDALAAVEAERDALRASVKSTEEDLYERAAEAESLRAALADAVAHCPSCGGRLRFKLRTCKGWEDRPCQRCKPWREALQL